MNQSLVFSIIGVQMILRFVQMSITNAFVEQSAKKYCMPQATQLASGVAGADEGCTSSATRAAVSAAVADARCIGQDTRAASNAAFVDEDFLFFVSNSNFIRSSIQASWKASMASAEGSDSDPTHNQPTQHVPQSSTEFNSSNHFFLSASENPGNILVTQPLLGMKNYQSWSRAMILALTTKKNIGFVNDKIAKPEIDSPWYEDWENCNTMVLSWLINSMHVDVSSSIIYCETTREMWLELQHVFSQGNGPKIYNLQQEISQITQGQLLVTEYYSKFKKLMDQLIHYEPLPACTCGAMKILSIAHEKSYMMRLLMGLNKSFETVRSHIPMLEPFPSMSKVYTLGL
nr:uncharacterized protein LOC112013836 [Quercus suber]